MLVKLAWQIPLIILCISYGLQIIGSIFMVSDDKSSWRWVVAAVLLPGLVSLGVIVFHGLWDTKKFRRLVRKPLGLWNEIDDPRDIEMVM